jgi:hypothetical protein
MCLRFERGDFVSNIARIVFAIVGAFATAALADEPVERNAKGERIWHITDYIKGTSPQIHDLLCGEIHRLNDKVRQTEKAVADDNAALENDKKPLIAAYLKGSEYLSAKADVAKYKAALDKAHAAEDTAAAMEAGSLYNKTRDAVKSMERAASAAADRNDEVQQDHVRLKADQENLARLQVSLKKAVQWHDELVTAMRNSAMIQWPLGEQSIGILGVVIPIDVDRDGTLTCIASVREDISTKDSGEGMVAVKQKMHPVRVTIKNANLPANQVKLNKPMQFDRNVEVETGHYVYGKDIDAIVVVEAKHSDLDDLLEAISQP